MSTRKPEAGSGTITLCNENHENLKALLEMILPYWVDRTKLNSRGVKICMLENARLVHTGITNFKHRFHPFLVCWPLREGEPEPNAFGYKEVAVLAECAKLWNGVQVTNLVVKIMEVLGDGKKIMEYHQQVECWFKSKEGLDQSSGYFPVYEVVFDATYYLAHLSLYLKYIHTSA